jgi:hypothetical protein
LETKRQKKTTKQLAMSANRYDKVVFVLLTFLAFAFLELFANEALVYLIAGGNLSLIKFTANRCEIFFIDVI